MKTFYSDNFISFYNQQLISFAEQPQVPLGLFYGKTGWAIYLFEMSRIKCDKILETSAVNIISNVCFQIDSLKSIDLKDGLAGIGLGINYLIKKKFIAGNVNEILQDIDDRIYREVSYPASFGKIDTLSKIQIVYYFLVRLKELKPTSENSFLFKELIMESINSIHKSIETMSFEEPLSYNVEYLLPQLLFLFSSLFELKFYNYRLTRITDELSYHILSIFPRLHFNRLYLLWAMDKLNNLKQDKTWEKHINLLYNQLDVNCIINDEIPSYNIFFNDGLVSIHKLLSKLKCYYSTAQMVQFEKSIMHKIMTSGAWDKFANDWSKCFGLYDGYSGTILSLNRITKNIGI